MNKSISESLKGNEQFLKKQIGEGFDIKYRHFKIPSLNNVNAFVVYASVITDTRVIDETILEPLMRSVDLPKWKVYLRNTASLLMEHGVFTTDVKKAKEWQKICDAVMEGDTVLFIDNCNSALILATKKYESRSIDEPISESEIKGPRDGFVENIQTNVSLIRRRIKDYGLRFDNIKLGERTKTVVLVAYIQSLVNEEILQDVKSKLEKIKIDGIMASQTVTELLEEKPISLFPKVLASERPDKVSSALLDGRIAIIVDNTPYVLIVPATFWQFMITSGDYYETYFLATFIRWMRLIALVLCISASPLYVLLTSFHQEMLPTALALKIAAGRNGVPFPAVMEAVLMEIILEIMKEAGLRMPKPLGQTVSIVGTLVIGQAAVSAGLVSPLLVIVIATAAISSYAIPSFSMSNAFRMIRFPILIATAFFGILGYLGSIIVLLLHMMSLHSFGVSYLEPIMPFDKDSNKDIFVRAPMWKMIKRPAFLKPKDTKRQEANAKPKPPAKR